MFTSVFNERSRSNPLRDFRLGTVVTSDYETPLTGYEPKKDLNLTTSSDIYWQHTLDDDASFLNDPDVDDNQLAEFFGVVVDSTGKLVEMRSDNDQFFCDTRNLKSVQSQFPLVTQPEMICQTGGSVQARIAEEREKALMHRFGQCLSEQRQDFHEVHQQDLMKHQEFQKFQNSTFDEFAQKKFIEDQKIIVDLSGRLQELQNEVYCMNDSKDFMDVESICSGNPHVTSPPGWPGGWGPQGMPRTGGNGLARVPNLRVSAPLDWGWHTQGGKDELTSCRGTV